MEFYSPAGHYFQILELSVRSFYIGAGYEFILNCPQTKEQDCRKIFQAVKSSFQVVSPRLNITGKLDQNNKYTDAVDKFEFSYPFSWIITNTYNSDKLSDNGALLKLPQDNFEHQKRIILHPYDISPDVIQITYGQDESAVESKKRIEMWKDFQMSKNSTDRKFIIKSEGEKTINSRTANWLDFEIVFANTTQLQGSITTITDRNKLYEMFLLCSPERQMQCNSAYWRVLETFKWKG